VIPQAAFNCNHCCPSPALFIEPNRLTLSKLESESESESDSPEHVWEVGTMLPDWERDP
jgi:hypothetical protein